MGRTRSGKSRLARALAESVRAQVLRADRGIVLILDPAGSDLCDLPGAVTVRTPELLDTAAERSRVVRLVPTRPRDLGVWDAAYAWAWDQGPAWVWCDEAGMILPVRRTPDEAHRYLTQGAKHQLGHLAAHTRPRDMDPNTLGQAAHVGCFDMTNPADRAYVADVVGKRPRDFEAFMDALGPFEFGWWSAGGQLRACAPLPPP